MTLWKPLRLLFIKSTDLTHGFQNNQGKLGKFYRFWASCYDFSVGLEPAYQRELRKMVAAVVRPGDVTLDIGCGTGLGALAAARIAAKVVGIDPSQAMLVKLQTKTQQQKLANIEIRAGFFPDEIDPTEKFDSVISSFMLAHLPPESRQHIIADMFDCLKPNGRLGLFGAQGEIASAFQTRDELMHNLSAAGFQEIQINDVSDIYRTSIGLHLPGPHRV